MFLHPECFLKKKIDTGSMEKKKEMCRKTTINDAEAIAIAFTVVDIYSLHSLVYYVGGWQRPSY